MHQKCELSLFTRCDPSIFRDLPVMCNAQTFLRPVRTQTWALLTKHLPKALQPLKCLLCCQSRWKRIYSNIGYHPKQMLNSLFVVCLLLKAAEQAVVNRNSMTRLEQTSVKLLRHAIICNLVQSSRELSSPSCPHCTVCWFASQSVNTLELCQDVFAVSQCEGELPFSQ